MSTRRVKSLDYEDDAYDDDYDEEYEEEVDGVTDEDRAQLIKGTAKVRSILGSDFEVSDKEIQDSLWHYYYDIDKTVTYIQSQKAAAEARAAKQATPSQKIVRLQPSSSSSTYPGPALAIPRQLSANEFFADCPWGNIPEARRAYISMEPIDSPGGLLGGSASGGPKKSKLAALAAARRKENSTGDKPASNTLNTSVALLDKLNLNKQPDSEYKAKRASEDLPTLSRPRKYPVRKAREEEPTPPKQQEPPSPEPEVQMPEEPEADVAEASAFAQVLCGPEELSIPTQDLLSPTFSAYQFAPGQSDPFKGPSPDDVVAQAQKGSKGLNKSAKPKSKASKMPKSGSKKDVESDIAKGVSKVTISEGPAVKSKNLDVLAEYGKIQRKNALNFVVIGHVDHGKSTLMGRLLLDLGFVEQRQFLKNQKEAEQMGKGSFALAWAMDQGTEERERGVTIDIAQKRFETDKTLFTILDAPGHRDFVPNMIAGASQADFAILVIDASTGAFESGLKGQTKEHALLARSIGVTRLVVAVNKMDSQSWDRNRFDQITGQMGNFLIEIGFQPQNVTFVPCSGFTGENVTKRTTASEAAWYQGPVLLEALEESEPVTRTLDGPLRLAITDVFRGGIRHPLSVSGRIDSGSLQVGDKLIVVPAGEYANVRGIEVDHEPADYAVAGQNVVLHLGDIDPKYLKTGDMLCTFDKPLAVVKSFLVKVLAFEHIMPMHLDVHRGRLHVPARISGLKALLDKTSGQISKKTPKIVKPGEVARLQVDVEEGAGIPLEKGMRVVFRSGGETIAAGRVEKELDVK